MLDEILRQIHVVRDVIESHLRFHHPEFCKVSRCVGVFGSEGRAERVDLSKSRSSELAFKLSAYRKAGLLAEKVFAVVRGAFFAFRHIIEVESGDLKHLSRSFAVRGGYKRCVEIDESFFVEILVYGVGHLAAKPEYGAESVCTGTHVSHRSQILQ